ncbi:TPA: hypothetical protein ACSPNY_001716 [Pseudomonas aeruginosa]
MSKELNKAPAEQAGGDERAAFEAWLAQAMSKKFEPEFDLAKYEDSGEYRYSPAAAYWKAWQARAALAQPSPPPHPAPELDFSRPLETENGDPVKWICADVIEYKSAQVCVAKDTGLVYSSPYIGLKIRNVMPEQAEAERPELWAVHAQGPDELYAGFSREDAEKHAAELNALPMPEGIAVGAVVVPSPWPEAEHWKYLAEQERDHKNEIAGRLRQFERICEGLPQGAIDGGWTAQGIRGYAKRLEDQLKAALARVAELELKLDKSDYAYDNDRIHMRGLAARAIARAKVFDDGSDGADAESARSVVAILRELLAVGPAQAQHSVPELLVRAEDFVSGFEDDDEQEGVSQLLADLRLAIGRAK